MEITQVRNTYAPSVSNKSQIEPTQQMRIHEQAVTSAALEVPSELLNGEEKKFFEQAFPNSLQEMRSYLHYDREGVKMASQLGSMIDRKG